MYILEYAMDGSRYLMFYRSIDYLNEAVRREGYMNRIQLADYTIRLSKDAKKCYVVKDRSGTLGINGQEHDVKKILRIIDILAEA